MLMRGGRGHLLRGGSRNFFKVSSFMDAFRVSVSPSPSLLLLGPPLRPEMDIGLKLVPAVMQLHSLTSFNDCIKIACMESIS